MNVHVFLEKVAYVDQVKSVIDGSPLMVYKSNFDDSYIAYVGMEDHVKYLADMEITQELTHGVGFSPKDNKWYGWSHRAIYGFEVGSTCNKGDCHYVAGTPEELIDDHANFFSDISEESAQLHREECQILDDRSGIRILHAPIKMGVASSVDDIVDGIKGAVLPVETLFENDFSEIKCGRGEWVAKTLEDAKQMAIDFNEGVS